MPSSKRADKTGADVLRKAAKANALHEIMTILWAPKANSIVNEPDLSGRTPLLIAAHANNIDATLILLKFSATGTLLILL